ncbi:MAG: hypothetical protein M1826_005501 [Phylliscum demangeonii]|nr:MAG: hypothetical protein M1826_005501 [Phylliscum demangeonii]
MVLAKSKNTYVISERPEASWVKMRSITEQAGLEEFLSTAELAGTDFTAEKFDSVKIIHPDQRNPYLLSAGEEKEALSKHKAHQDRLTVPRRPPWNEDMKKAELETSEREAFLEWRRGLAQLQEQDDLFMTPFERNIEVWRQLWRVIERSDLVVQIVDARNPLLFRSEDLEAYVKEVDRSKNNLLLVNKADMLTVPQRQAWADYFAEKGIAFSFFSASLAKTLNEAEEEGEDGKGNDDTLPQEEENTADGISINIANSDHPRKITVGLVGYPNVGKSSTINAMLGAKKVSVSATPGKTKHFQTIHLSPAIILCDCPGLVFPNFATTKAELVCNGILPIDQLREFTGPVGLVCQRIPKQFLEAVYGIRVLIRPFEEGGTGIPTAEELLVAYATARGFTKTGQGQPDEARAARYILKAYVSGKLLFCCPPPRDPPFDIHEFNRELYDTAHLPANRQGWIFEEAEDSLEADNPDHVKVMHARHQSQAPRTQGEKSARIDRNFFADGRGSAGHLSMPFNYKYSERGSVPSKPLSGRKQKEMAALVDGVDPSEARLPNDKRHFKGKKARGKSVMEE